MEPLFQEFKDRYQQQGLVDCDNGIILDGIINQDRYDAQTHKILFIAKEHNRLNDLYAEGDYRSWWETHVKYGFSHRISEWAYGIANNFPDYSRITHEDKEIALKSIAFMNIKKNGFSHRISEWAYGIANNFPDYSRITHEDKEIALKSIAFMNIKKTCGGATANPEVLFSYINNSRDILQRQISEISPSIIVCCFRHDYLPKQLFGFDSMEETPNGFHYHKRHGIPIINFYHPSARKNKALLYSQLKEAVNFAITN